MDSPKKSICHRCGSDVRCKRNVKYILRKQHLVFKMKLGIIINELFRGLLHNLEANKRALKKELQSRLSFDL